MSEEEREFFECPKCKKNYDMLIICYAVFHVTGRAPNLQYYCPDCMEKLIDYLNDWIFA